MAYSVQPSFPREHMDLIGVCFDGSGRAAGQAHAPEVLRAAGLVRALPQARLLPDITLPPPNPTRGPLAGFLNESALLAMIDAVYDQVQAALRAEHFPLLYGADCAVLLGAVPALRDVDGAAGLLSLDGHEDATPWVLSSTGEAANMEIALLLGLDGAPSPAPLCHRVPALQERAVALLGQRDVDYRAQIGVASIAHRVRLCDVEEVRRDPTACGRQAAEHIRYAATRWWLHIDLDVLDRKEFSACGAASDASMPQGLTWAELSAATIAALAISGCSGWSIGVYNTDLDPTRQAAERIVEFIKTVIARRAT